MATISSNSAAGNGTVAPQMTADDLRQFLKLLILMLIILFGLQGWTH